MSNNYDEIITTISNMSVSEMSELISIIEEKFNVSANPVVGAAVAGGDSSVEEKTEFDVHLVGLGSAPKVKVIQTVKAETGLSLVESRDLAANLPAVLKKGLSKEDSDKIKDKFASIGAEVEIK